MWTLLIPINVLIWSLDVFVLMIMATHVSGNWHVTLYTIDYMYTYTILEIYGLYMA